MQPYFYPWLFDNHDAWNKSLEDPRYSYDLPMSHFMSLYQEHRKGIPAPLTATHTPQKIQVPPSLTMQPSAELVEANSPAGAGQILSQSEIDALLTQLH